jgi:tetratricopeptide (TPR) repeat protein
MTAIKEESIDWDADIAVDDEEIYESLMRAIARTEGFGLFFVRCVEKDRAKLEQRLRGDLPKLRFERLELQEELKDGNLYRRVAEVSQRVGPFNGLFISGLEKSLDPYVKSGYGGLGDYYNKDMVPRLLGHLNLQRERFRDDFPFCLIFFLSAFGIKYIARRAPDFFDWRSGLFEFVADAAELGKLTQELLWGSYDEYLTWAEAQRLDRIREIQTLIDEDRQTSSGKLILFLQKAGILIANQSYEEVITSLDKVIELKGGIECLIWQVRGQILNFLNRYEEALISYEKALTSCNNVLGFKSSTLHPVWYDFGNALSNLNRYEEAITSYDKAIEYEPDDHEAWHNRGNALYNLNRYEEAIASYDKAIEYKPDGYKSLTSRGNALSNLNRYEEAIASYDKAIEYKPDDNIVWYNRACVHALAGEINLAFADLTEAFRLNPEESRKLAATNSELEPLRENPRFKTLLDLATIT